MRQTAHDINHNRTADGGIMLMLDNAKAFDRLQHTFMIEVLQAFNLPPDIINAVRTLPGIQRRRDARQSKRPARHALPKHLGGEARLPPVRSALHPSTGGTTAYDP